MVKLSWYSQPSFAASPGNKQTLLMTGLGINIMLVTNTRPPLSGYWGWGHCSVDCFLIKISRIDSNISLDFVCGVDDCCKPLNWKHKSLRILQWLVQTDNFKIRLRRGILEEHWLEAAALQEDLFHFVTWTDVWGHLFPNIGKHLKPFDNLRWQTMRLEAKLVYREKVRTQCDWYQLIKSLV